MTRAMARKSDPAIPVPERRKSHRADWVVRVEYRTVDELFSEFARNINEGGIFVETETPHEPGTTVDLQFRLPASDEPVRVTGTVVRVTEGSPGAGEPAGVGIEFDELDAETRERVDELVRGLRAS